MECYDLISKIIDEGFGDTERSSSKIAYMAGFLHSRLAGFADKYPEIKEELERDLKYFQDRNSGK